MKHKRELKWLLLLLLPVGIIPLATLANAEKPAALNIGSFPTDAQGEPRALGTLSQLLKQDPTNSIVVYYMTPEEDETRNNPRKSQNFSRLWGYDLMYNRRQKTLTKMVRTEMPIDESDPTHTWIWHNVEETAIHQVAAPIQKRLQTTRTSPAENFKGVSIKELEKYGATLDLPN